MASYAALLSLLHTLNQIKNHPRPPITLDQHQLDYLIINLTLFQDFLERNPSQEGEDLERRIAAAAYEAEDLIKSHIAYEIHASSTSHDENLSWLDLYGDLESVIHIMDLIKEEVMVEMVKEKSTEPQLYDEQLWRHSLVSASSRQSSTTAGFDDVLIKDVLDQLSGQQSSLQVISIVGMGGIGKTTFATNIYWHPLIVHHFDILAWVTISQVYRTREILLQILSQANIGSEISEDELGVTLHKTLYGRRYLIVMDDMWSSKTLDEIRCFLPDNNNRSRIMITTRLSNLALELSGSHIIQMQFLNEDKSWGLLCKTVFGNELGCPIKLENTGKQIAKNCRGLPLSLVVIGGLLRKSNWTLSYWKYTLQNLNSLLNLEDNEYCLQVLGTSYKGLPVYLKPCFLYMGYFLEDSKINVSKLIKLWIAEGILRTMDGKIFEEVAEKYVKELIDRNLILVDELRWDGKAKLCKMHDLLRDLCIREAHKQRFRCVLKHQQYLNMGCRICIHRNTKEKHSPQFLHVLESVSLSRPLFLTLISEDAPRVYSEDICYCGLDSAGAIFQIVNLRFLNIDLGLRKLSRFPSSWFLFWNLQTLKIDIQYSLKPVIAPSEFWEMPLLRHIIIKDLELLGPVCGENTLILKDLHTLSRVCNFKFSESAIKRIPNIKTMKLKYQISSGEKEYLDFGLDNFSHLKKLQSLNISINGSAVLEEKLLHHYLVQNLSLPQFLKKLTLCGTMLSWEECTTKIGSLPLLEYLRLGWSACYGAEWETVEGKFCNLKVLQMDGGCSLRCWITDSTHFPCLEHLVLRFVVELEEVPSSISDITTLKSIRLDGCSAYAVHSMKRIEEEQLDLGNMDLQLHISAHGAKTLFSHNGFYYLKEVKNTFQYQTEKFDMFVKLMVDSKALSIDINGVIGTLKLLFRGHRNLIYGFNMFLPEGYEISLDDEEDSAKGMGVELGEKDHIIFTDSGHLKKTSWRRLWSPDEDEELKNYTTKFGVGNWNRVPELTGIKRSGNSCRLRWLNYLRPDLPRRGLSSQELDLIIYIHDILESRWKKIASGLPGSTANELKNLWREFLVEVSKNL